MRVYLTIFRGNCISTYDEVPKMTTCFIFLVLVPFLEDCMYHNKIFCNDKENFFLPIAISENLMMDNKLSYVLYSGVAIPISNYSKSFIFWFHIENKV